MANAKGETDAGGLSRQDTNPARRGTEPETAYRQEALDRAAAEERAKFEAERQDRADARARAVAAPGDAGEDKEHGSIAATVVPEAQEPAEAEVGGMEGQEAAAAVGEVTSFQVQDPETEEDQPTDPPTRRRGRPRKDG